MAKVKHVSATREGLLEAAEWLEDYASKLQSKANAIIDSMLSKGEAYAFFTLGHYDTGETAATIVGYREGNVGVLLVAGNAVWIEFGTGVVANAGNTPHPKASELGMSPWGYSSYMNITS